MTADFTNPFYGKPLLYLTGAEEVHAHPGVVVEAPYGQDVIGDGLKIAYCDLYPLLGEQFARAKSFGFEYVELDHAQCPPVAVLLRAIETAQEYRLGVILKNPILVEGGTAARTLMSHPNVFGAIVGRHGGSPVLMDALRTDAGKIGMMPIWFVFDGSSGANQCADQIRKGEYRGMGVSRSTGGFRDSISVLTPRP